MDIALNKILPIDSLRNYLNSLGFDKKFILVNNWEGYDFSDDSQPVIYKLDSEKKYHMFLDFVYLIVNHTSELHRLCIGLSKAFNCSVWFSDALYQPNSNPCWGTLYSKGKVFIASDVEVYSYPEDFKFTSLQIHEEVVKSKVCEEKRDLLNETL